MSAGYADDRDYRRSWRMARLSSPARSASWWLVPADSTLPDMALRFILANPDVATVIPGMRRPAHVRANIAASDRGPLDQSLVAKLREHRWDRRPTSWSM